MEGNRTRGLVVDIPPALAPLFPTSSLSSCFSDPFFSNRTPLNSHPFHSKPKVGLAVSSSLSGFGSGQDEQLLEGFVQRNDITWLKF